MLNFNKIKSVIFGFLLVTTISSLSHANCYLDPKGAAALNKARQNITALNSLMRKANLENKINIIGSVLSTTCEAMYNYEYTKIALPEAQQMQNNACVDYLNQYSQDMASRAVFGAQRLQIEKNLQDGSWKKICSSVNNFKPRVN